MVQSNVQPIRLGLFWRVLGFVLIPLDFIAVASFLGAAPCLGGNGLEKCSDPHWKLVAVALLSTLFYFYKRRKANPSGAFSWRGNSRLSWDYAVFLFLMLVFIGESLPEVASYIRGIPRGEYGFHVALLDNIRDLITTGRIYDLVIFFILAAVFAFVYRKLHWLIATPLAAVTGAIIEYNLFNRSAGFDTYNPDLNFWGTIIFLIAIWTVLYLLPFMIFSAADRRWGSAGRNTVIIVILAINILAVLFFAYERSKNPVDESKASIDDRVFPEKSCPDQMLLNNGPVMVYSNGKEFTIKDGSLDWIKANCPNTKTIYQKPNK